MRFVLSIAVVLVLCVSFASPAFSSSLLCAAGASSLSSSFSALASAGAHCRPVHTPAGSGLQTATTTYQYGYGNPLKMISPAHQGTAFVDSTNAYDPNTGNLTETLDAKGNPTAYFYNSATGTDYLTGTMDAAGHTTSMAYDNSGNMTGLTDANQVTTTFGYDANGNKSSQSVPVTLASGPATLVTQYQYDDNGNLTKTIAPDGSSTQTIYNDLGKVDHTIDAGGRTTQYTYDDLGQLITTTYPDTSTTQTVYDANGNTIATKDQMGRWSGTQYDALGRTVHTGPLNTTTPVTTSGSTITYNWLTDTTTSLPIYTTTVYNDDGTVASELDENGNKTSYTYDGYGRKFTEQDGFGVTIATYSYDANGNQTSVTTPAPAGSSLQTVTTQSQYDENNRLVTTTYQDNTTSQVGYNTIGQKISDIDQNSLTTQFDYDQDGRLWHVWDPLGQQTTFGYDEAGNKTTQMDANGHTTTFAYDDMGRLAGKTLPAGQSESMTYNLDGTLHSTTDYNGHVTTYGYDSMGRQNLISHDDGTGVSVVYNADGSKQSATRTNPGGTQVVTHYNYDTARGWLNSEETSYGSVDYTITIGHDDAGNVTGIQSPSGTKTYTYDSDSRLKTVTSPDSATTTLTYDHAGNLTNISLPNGVLATNSYDTLNRLTGIAYTVNSTALASFNYLMDAGGRRTQLADSINGTTVYGLDKDSRLTGEAGAINNAYGYDPVGNRTVQTIAGTSSTFSFDKDDRNGVLTYDNNGNVTGLGSQTISYDEDNELITDNAGAGATSSRLYDADGNLVQETVNGTTTNYVWDPSSGYPTLLEERDGNNNLLDRFDWAGSALIRADLTNGGGSTTTYFPLTDGLGSVRALTSTAGAITDTWNYDAYGNSSHASGSASMPLLFNAELLDATGLYYLRARWYNPETGTFLSQDPLGGRGEGTASVSLYPYAQDNPVDDDDPLGLFTSTPTLGYAVEDEIEAEYRREFPTHLDQATFGAWQRFDLFGWVPPNKRALGVIYAYLKPDIFDPDVHQYGEIKPFSLSGIGAGFAKMALNMAAYGPKVYNRYGVFIPTIWEPPLKIMANGEPIFTFNIDGVIFYSDTETDAWAALQLAALGLSLDVMKSLLRQVSSGGVGQALDRAMTKIQWGVSASKTAETAEDAAVLPTEAML